jgi:hypothetical protein
MIILDYYPWLPATHTASVRPRQSPTRKHPPWAQNPAQVKPGTTPRAQAQPRCWTENRLILVDLTSMLYSTGEGCLIYISVSSPCRKVRPPWCSTNFGLTLGYPCRQRDLYPYCDSVKCESQIWLWASKSHGKAKASEISAARWKWQAESRRTSRDWERALYTKHSFNSRRNHASALNSEKSLIKTSGSNSITPSVLRSGKGQQLAG